MISSKSVNVCVSRIQSLTDIFFSVIYGHPNADDRNARRRCGDYHVTEAPSVSAMREPITQSGQLPQQEHLGSRVTAAAAVAVTAARQN